MIPLSYINSPQNYAYVSGCRNAVWIVGYLVEINRAEGTFGLVRKPETIFDDEGNYVPPTSFIPLELAEGDRIHEDLRNGMQVKTISHLYSGLDEIPEDMEKDPEVMRLVRMLTNQVTLVCKFMGRPSVLDMAIRNEALTETNLAQDRYSIGEELRATSNTFEVAGFVESHPYVAPGVTGNTADDRLIIRLRQSQHIRNSLPIEIAGRLVPAYKKAIRMGQAIRVQGTVLPGRNAENEIIPVLRAQHVHQTNEDKDFTFKGLPQWVLEIRANLARQRQAAIAASQTQAAA